MCDAGLDARIDGIGNVFGQSRGVERALLIGSHTDTVPRGGWLDGALGVIYGLEIARARSESGEPGPLGVDVISFADEESAYLGMAGSRAFCGYLSDAEIEAARHEEGRSLREALVEAGYADRPFVRLAPDRHLAYLEAHIEQGPRLEAEGRRIGVVTGIVGIRRIRVTFSGRADHAGTTPMHLRKDAGVALIEFCHELRPRLEETRGADGVWNLGQVAFDPGVGNVVPGSAEVLIEYRNQSVEVLDRMEAEIQAAVAAADGRGGVTADGDTAPGPDTDGSGHRTGRSDRSGGARARGGASPDAERGRARRHGAEQPAARRHAVRTQHRRPQSRRGRGHRGGGHRPRGAGHGRCGSACSSTGSSRDGEFCVPVAASPADS